jgi:hypothetical protein
MEQVLDVYAEAVNPDQPLVNMDEASKELHADLHEPLPMRPGTPQRQDDKYERHGTCNLFMFFAPHLGWRRVGCRPNRARTDWAHEVRRLLDEDFPKASCVTLVCDNLNTHGIASLYATFPAEEAHRLARRLRLVHTPRNGSWLNVAEVELSVLSRQCLDRRISDSTIMEKEVAAWTTQRNATDSKVTWQFTTADARIKLRHLYPQF